MAVTAPLDSHTIELESSNIGILYRNNLEEESTFDFENLKEMRLWILRIPLMHRYRAIQSNGEKE
jgi:hypothetical protein